MSTTVATEILAPRRYPTHTARHRRAGTRSWLRRTAFWAGVGFAAVTFLLGLVGWVAMLSVIL